MPTVQKKKTITFGPIDWRAAEPGVHYSQCAGATPFDRTQTDYNTGSMFLWYSAEKSAQADRECVHIHMAEEAFIVLEGTMYLGLDDHYDPDKAVAYGPGSIAKIAYREAHYQWYAPGDFVCLYVYFGHPELTYCCDRKYINKKFEQPAGCSTGTLPDDKNFINVDFRFNMQSAEMAPGYASAYELFGGNLPGKKEDSKYRINTFALWYSKELLTQVDRTWVHVHLGEEHSIILDGKIHVVNGDKYDPEKESMMPPGSIFSIPIGRPHWEWFDEDSEMLAIINSFMDISDQYTCGIDYSGDSDLIPAKTI